MYIYRGFIYRFVNLMPIKSLVARYRKEQNEFLSRIINTCDETWVHHCTPESKRSSMQWKHVSSPGPKKFTVQPICRQDYGLCF